MRSLPPGGSLLSGYRPGVIGEITQAHATYYHENWALDASFEIQVATELSDFVRFFDPTRDGLWVGRMGGRLAGSVAIDGRGSPDPGARLRWLIVPPEFQGMGLGRRLVEEALAFCAKAGHPRVFLWTFQGLDAARALYESVGFRLCREHTVVQWGQTLREQLFELDLAPGRTSRGS